MKYIYLGGGFQPGIPAKDLSEEEFDALPDEAKARVISSGLYRLVEQPKPHKAEVKESRNDKSRS